MSQEETQAAKNKIAMGKIYFNFILIEFEVVRNRWNKITDHG